MNKTILAGAITAMALAAAPFALAQSMPPAPPSPPATEQPAPPTMPSDPANPSTPAPPSASTSAPPAEEGREACRTRKPEGEQCSCLSAPTTFGTAKPASSGAEHNMCVIPEA